MNKECRVVVGTTSTNRGMCAGDANHFDSYYQSRPFDEHLLLVWDTSENSQGHKTTRGLGVELIVLAPVFWPQVDTNT